MELSVEFRVRSWEERLTSKLTEHILKRIAKEFWEEGGCCGSKRSWRNYKWRPLPAEIHEYLQRILSGVLACWFSKGLETFD